MRRLFLLFILISGTCYSQLYNYEFYVLNFEDTTHHGRLFIDTLSNPNNIWQIGSPSKNIFSEAYSVPNVIVTDTINPYPVSDSSSFLVTHRVSIALDQGRHAQLGGFYKVDSDSLNDFGMIELSPDNGITWLSVLDDPSFIWSSAKPVLTGSSDWTYFWAEFDGSGYDFNLGDSILFRFTFFSDDNQSNRDGLMFDDLVFEDFFEGITANNRKIYSQAYPNPARSLLFIEYDRSVLQYPNIVIYDCNGKMIGNAQGINNGLVEFDISLYPSGIYYYRLFSPGTNGTSHGKFIVE